MNIRHAFILLLIAAATIVSAETKLAIAEPIATGGLKPEEVNAFWGILESSIKSEEYTVVSRAALKQMMTEIGLATTSDLLNLNSRQKAKLGQVEGVNLLLVSEVGTFGTRVTCTMRLVNASTGEIDKDKAVNLRCKDLDDLADKIDVILERMLSTDKPEKPLAALLKPIVKDAKAPATLADDLHLLFEPILISTGYPIQNMQNVTKILKEQGLGDLDSLEPKQFKRVGEILEVQALLQVIVTQCEVLVQDYLVEETGNMARVTAGSLTAMLRVIDTSTGNVTASIPAMANVSSRQMDRQMTRGWTADDYRKYMLVIAIQDYFMPALAEIKPFAK